MWDRAARTSTSDSRVRANRCASSAIKRPSGKATQPGRLFMIRARSVLPLRGQQQMKTGVGGAFSSGELKTRWTTDAHRGYVGVAPATEGLGIRWPRRLRRKLEEVRARLSAGAAPRRKRADEGGVGQQQPEEKGRAVTNPTSAQTFASGPEGVPDMRPADEPLRQLRVAAPRPRQHAVVIPR